MARIIVAPATYDFVRSASTAVVEPALEGRLTVEDEATATDSKVPLCFHNLADDRLGKNCVRLSPAKENDDKKGVKCHLKNYHNHGVAYVFRKSVCPIPKPDQNSEI